MTAALYSADDGIKVYSMPGLGVYDALIMGAVTRYVWSCPPEEFVRHYRQNVRRNHADIGVGTGYCLDRCGLAPGRTRLALIDLQPNCLNFAARRLARYRPEKHLWDAGEPSRYPLDGIEPFDSVALGGILHCLPGDMTQKARVFDALRAICNPGATVFGYTLVNDAIPRRTRRRLVSRLFHRLGVVNFESDSLAALDRELSARFADYELELVGCFAFFTTGGSHP